ncbi:hypothetical protein [Streptomyces sp. ALI-76-A]
MPKAYVFARDGGPQTGSETEAVAGVGRPVPGAAQILVAVRCAAIVR